MFNWYFREFRKTDEYQALETVCENSPFHRERNVAEHTDFVTTLTQPNELAFYAAAFHDTGKAVVKKEKFNKKFGHYLSFKTHERVSSRLWENYSSAHPFLSLEDRVKISYLIEFHQPRAYSVKRLEALSATLSYLNSDFAFKILLKADAAGRLSDNWVEEQKQTSYLIEQLEELSLKNMFWWGSFKTSNKESRPRLVIPIAPAGAGKSTCFEKLANQEEFAHFGLDALRLELFSDPRIKNSEENYHQAYFKSRKCSKFKPFAKERFGELLRTKKNIFLDNVNLTRVSREFYINEAKMRGYYIQACLIPIALNTVCERQKTRGDKCVPDDVVRNMYMNLELPLLFEEVDSIMWV